MSILMFVNLKGGVAKTTNTVAIGECLASSGLRVLVIDADHQCMSSEVLLGEDRLIDCDRDKRTLHDLMAALLDPAFPATELPRFVQAKGSDIGGGIPTLSVIPCSIRIDDFQTNVAKAKKGFRSTDEFQAAWKSQRSALRTWLKRDFDFTLIDCPPSIAPQVKFLLGITDSYIIPSIPDRLSVRGCRWLHERIRRLGFKKNALGILWSLYREQSSLHRRFVEDAVHRRFPFDFLPPPFETIIPNATAIVESFEPGRRPKSFNAKYSTPFAQRYRDLSEEIVTRSQWRPATASETHELERTQKSLPTP